MPLACACSLVLIQIFLHHESVNQIYVKPFIIWAIQLVIVQALSSRRGFFHRFSIVALVIGLLLLPYLSFWGQQDEIARAGLEGSVGLANPNDLARWFGFLAVYFLTAGIETTSPILRYTCWPVALGSLLVIGLTVSRGVLIAVLIAAIIAFRRVLKGGFLPLLILALILFVAYETGIFDQALQSYAARGEEETGRWLVWPLIMNRLIESPIAGVGVTDVATYVPDRGLITPHNPFLLIALSSGLVPLVFFLSYWFQAALRVFNVLRQRFENAPFLISAFVYVLLAIIPENLQFTSHWAMVTVAAAFTPSALRRVRAINADQAKVVASLTRRNTAKTSRGNTRPYPGFRAS